MSGTGDASADGASGAAPARVPPRPKIRPFPTPTRLRAAPSGVHRPPSWSSRRFLPPSPTSRLPSASSIAAAAIASSSVNNAAAAPGPPPPPPRRRAPPSSNLTATTQASKSMEAPSAPSRNHSSTAPSNSTFATTVQGERRGWLLHTSHAHTPHRMFPLLCSGDTESRFTFHSDIPLPPQYRRCKKAYMSGNISKTMPKLNPPPASFRVTTFFWVSLPTSRDISVPFAISETRIAHPLGSVFERY